MGEQPEKSRPSGFAVFLRVIAVASVIASLIIGYFASSRLEGYYYQQRVINEGVYAVYIALGVLSAVGWWALSYVVDACIKYLNKD